MRLVFGCLAFSVSSRRSLVCMQVLHVHGFPFPDSFMDLSILVKSPQRVLGWPEPMSSMCRFLLVIV